MSRILRSKIKEKIAFQIFLFLLKPSLQAGCAGYTYINAPNFYLPFTFSKPKRSFEDKSHRNKMIVIETQKRF
jgi:hypothetical protein